MRKIIFMFLVLLFPGIVFADNVSLNCPSEVAINTEYSCTLSGYTDSGVFSLSSKVIVGGNVQFIGFVTNKDLWQGDGANGDVLLYREDNVTGSFLIGTIKLKSTNTSDNVVTIEEVTFFNSDVIDGTDVNPISRIIRVKENSSIPPTTKKNDMQTTTKKSDSNDTTTKKASEEPTTKVVEDTNLYLSDLIIEGYDLDFYYDTYEYTLQINDEKELVITPVVEDNSITYEIFGNRNLGNGSVIKIDLSDDDGNTQEYKIKITKDEVKEKKNYSLIFIIVIGVLVVINVLRILLSKRKGSVE